MTQLQRTLGPVMIWALGVGYVISGSYFGWNYGLPEGGPYGMLAALALVTVMYVTFVLSYAELACALPRAGGAFVYAHAAFGPLVGFVAGVAQLIEFVFAPPAIAFAIGAYLNKLVPALSPAQIGAIAFVLFTALNVWGVKQSAIFELVITVVAVIELLIFAGVAAPHFSWAAFSKDPLPNGWWGVLPAIPFAIWFYLAIEGVANIAEEAKDPTRDLSRGFGSAMLTLVVLALITFFSAVGVDGWRTVVYLPGTETTSDSPLPLALGKIVGETHPLYRMLIGIGLCGLLASFHGIILAAGRATFEMGRMGFAPPALGRAHAGLGTPVVALLVNSAIGVAALFGGEGVTGNIISVSVLGALTLYVISLASLFQLRRTRPDLPRPFVTPLYPVVPAVSLVLALVCLGATLYYSKLLVTAAYLGVLEVALLWYLFSRLTSGAAVRRQA
jgi:ethanolamine permease